MPLGEAQMLGERSEFVIGARALTLTDGQLRQPAGVERAGLDRAEADVIRAEADV